MILHVDAIFSQGTFRPPVPLTLPEVARVHLRIDEKTDSSPLQLSAKNHSPKLAHPEDAADFVMQIREAGDAGV